MAEVLTLPLDLSADGVRRLAAKLEADARSGMDLCPRRAQITCLCASLTRSLRELREALGRAAEELPEGAPTLCVLRDAAACVIWLAQVMMAGATGLHAHPAPGA